MKKLLLSWLFIGAITTVTGFVGALYPLLSILLIFPVVSFWFLIRPVGNVVRKRVVAQQWSEVFLMGVLLFIWGLHASGIMVPETGFDAVWYHLPVIDRFLEYHRIVYVPEYYQSVNPLLSDLIFLLGYQVAGEVGAKAIAYSLALTLLMISYRLARLYLSQFWSLLFIIQVSLIQVVTWQASSFYVDVAKAMWELGAMYLLLANPTQKTGTKETILSGLFFGASLATKQFSLLLLPVMLVIVYLKDKNVRLSCYWLLAALFVPLPFYTYSWMATGDPFFSISIHLAKINEIGSNISPLSHFMTQLLSLPYLLWHLLFEARDYVSPLLLLLTPFALLQRKMLHTYWPLLVFSFGQFLIWWFVPPLSTRYALSGFVTLLLVLFIATADWIKKNSKWNGAIIGGILLVSGFLLLPRLYVLTRNLRYLSGHQNKTEYLHLFFDGNNDQHLIKWHQLEFSPGD
ncbi:MAG TPA: hypothetical protein VF209_03140 [Patescibacteria group bacterium]